MCPIQGAWGPVARDVACFHGIRAHHRRRAPRAHGSGPQPLAAGRIAPARSTVVETRGEHLIRTKGRRWSGPAGPTNMRPARHDATIERGRQGVTAYRSAATLRFAKPAP